MNIGFHPLLGAAAIACNSKDYVTVCVTLNHVSLSFSALCNEVVYRIVGRDGRAMDRCCRPPTRRRIGSNHIIPQKETPPTVTTTRRAF
jgi:hypothetical protein